MRVFDHPNMTGGFTCPICGTGEDKPVVLVGLAGTEEGDIMEARQYHLDCIELTEHEGEAGRFIVYMMFDPKEAPHDPR